MSKFYVVSQPMRIAVFLVYLCSLLFAGHYDSSAGVSNDDIAHVDARYNGFKYYGAIASENEESYVATDDVQDDDNDDSVVRKCKLPVKYDFGSSHRFFLNFFHLSSFSDRVLHDRGTPRFLMLRTLRI